MRTVDCRGLACPQPVTRTRDALRDAASPLLVIVDNEAALTNVSRFAESQGARVTVSRQGGELHLTIEPAGKPSGDLPAACTPVAGGTVVLVSSEVMGRGDDDLGAILINAFLDTLGQFRGEISHAIFVNTGVRLAVEGSPVLDHLRQLEQIGTRVLVCGTCLNHFGIKDRLAAGSVSNMYEIIETLSRAARIIQT